MSAKAGFNIATALGLVISCGSIFGGGFIEFNELNPDLGTEFLQLSALLIIFGGTFGCTIISVNMEHLKTLPKVVGIAFQHTYEDPKALINTIVKLAEFARREGVLALESKTAELTEKYPFMAAGIRHVIDGSSTEVVKAALNNEIASMEERHKMGAEMFNSMGGNSPTMGVIGTVMGLIAALGKAGESSGDPSAIVGAIATAFIATFYGVAASNLVFLPIGAKLKMMTDEEVFIKNVMTEAILAIQNGDNPRNIAATLSVCFRKDLVK